MLSKRDEILRINLRNLTDQEVLPLEQVENVISLEYEMEGECVFYGDTDQRKIFKQCLNGSPVEVLVHSTQTVEGEYFDLHCFSKHIMIIDSYWFEPYFIVSFKQNISLKNIDFEVHTYDISFKNNVGIYCLRFLRFSIIFFCSHY